MRHAKPLLLAAMTLAAALVSCSEGRERSPAELLPTKLTTEPEPLRRESFTGPVFVRAKFQLASPVTVDLRRFLALLERRPQELTVGWAVSNYEGHIKVFAFRVAGARGSDLIRAYLKAITIKIAVGHTTIADKRVTTTSVGLPIRGYFYSWRDVLFIAVDTGLRPGELREIFGALP